ncbi:hypothetical protein SAMN04515665_108125 [Blastococcus sp. DSM 46786]|uniref:hypothetical protein n=1 Tax=Blastococcus sp. DSM 46786 TaxID=1798227 RepID=UPI0008B1B599|nr:hypothetical protein [Blastococcus sp. DSM 46786]SEL11286.1 hypothetical protein SAMN04515665_108125 [Blastococcus sp. DSM 46786]
MTGTFLRGLAAGALGTVVLDAATSLDMALRGRPASSVPERTVDAAAAALDRDVPGRGQVRRNRRSALGALTGIGNGLASGVLASALRSAGVRFPAPLGALVAGGTSMALTDGAVAALGVEDPRTWGREEWLADVLPHLAYGAAVQTVLESVPTDAERAAPVPPPAALTARALLLGVATGGRSSLGFAGPALTAPTRPGAPGHRSRPARVVALASLAGELVADKHPATPDRTQPGALGGRLVAAAVGGTSLAARERVNGALPLVAAVAGGLAGSVGGLRWRRWAASRMPDLQAALLEDAVALGLAAAACLPGRSRPPLVAVPR